MSSASTTSESDPEVSSHLATRLRKTRIWESKRLDPVAGLTLADPLIDPSEGPAVPPALPASLTGRIAVSIVAAIGFYTLVIVIALGMIAAPYLAFRYSPRIPLYVFVAPLVGLAMLRALLPRRQAAELPGHEISRSDHPRLWDAIQEVSAATDSTPPDTVVLLPEVNAFVTDLRSGWFGRRRVMGIGVPLMQVLNVAELKAVVAHEFGHFVGGDTRAGRLVYALRRSMVRAIQAGNNGIRVVLHAYATRFVSYTQRVSRAQEFAADQLAARTIGARTTASALVKVEQAGIALDDFHATWASLIEADHRPPMLEGFHTWIGLPHNVANAKELLGQHRQPNPYDSHPTLKERLAALRPFDPDESGLATGGESSVSLLDDVDALDEPLVSSVLTTRAMQAPKATWNELGAAARARWQTAQHSDGQSCRGLRPDMIPDSVDAFIGVVRASSGLSQAQVNDRRMAQRFIPTVHSLTCLALEEAGWRPEFALGRDVVFHRDGLEFHPGAWVGAQLSGKLDDGEWVALTREAGIADTDLGALAPA